MGHERLDQQGGTHVNGTAHPGSAVVGAGMVLPPGGPAERLYGPGDKEAEAGGWAAADVDPGELVGDEDTAGLPDAGEEDERAPDA